MLEITSFFSAASWRRFCVTLSLLEYVVVLLVVCLCWPGTVLAESNRFAFGVNGLDFSLSRYSVAADGRLRHLGHIPLVKSVPYVLLDPTGNFVLVPSKTVSHISVFRLNKVDGSLTEVPGSPFKAEAVSPFTLAFHPSGHFLYAAARFSGVGAYRFDQETGALAPITGSPYPAGERTRGVTVHPSGNFLYASNGYSNSVSAYRIDAVTGGLTALPNSPYSVGDMGEIDYRAFGMEDVPVGAGGIPYDVTIDPQGRFAFVVNWAAANISVFQVDVESGHLNAVKGSPFFTGFNPYRVQVHPKGGFVYVTQFSTSEIAVHAIDDKTGELRMVQGSPFSTGGSGPVAVNFNGDGSQLYVPNYESNDISLFDVNAGTGALRLREVVKTRSGPWYVAVTNEGADSKQSSVKSASEHLLLAQNTGGLARLDTGTGNIFRAEGTTETADRLVQVTLPVGRFVYVLNRAKARLETYRMQPPSGQLKAVDGGSISTGKNPSQLTIDANGWYLYVTNADDDTMSVYFLDPQTGLPRSSQKGPATPTGKRPVSVVLDEAARYAYVVNEGDNSVSVYSYMNSVTPLIFNSRSAGSPFAVGDSPAAISIDPTGRFAYVANYGSNNVSAFRVHHQTGSLSALPGSPFVAGQGPVSSVAHPNGQWLLVANEKSNDISIFQIEAELGALKSQGDAVSFSATFSAKSPSFKPGLLRFNAAGNMLYVLSKNGRRWLSYSFDAVSGILMLKKEKRFVKPVSDMLVSE